jgi:hypothetical protein
MSKRQLITRLAIGLVALLVLTLCAFAYLTHFNPSGTDNSGESSDGSGWSRH